MHQLSGLRYAFAAVFVSALWMHGGYLSLKAGRSATGFGWILIGLLLVVAFGINSFIGRDWLNLGAAVLILGAEVWLINSDLFRGEKDKT
jgi:hypothetical protein